MTKEQVVAQIAQRGGLQKKEAEAAWLAAQDVIASALRDGDEVMIAGVGKLVLSERSARTARNPQTGEPIQIPAKKVPKLRPSKKFAIG